MKRKKKVVKKGYSHKHLKHLMTHRFELGKEYYMIFGISLLLLTLTFIFVINKSAAMP